MYSVYVLVVMSVLQIFIYDDDNDDVTCIAHKFAYVHKL